MYVMGLDWRLQSMNERPFISNGRVVEMSCDQCPAMPGEHCNECSVKNGRQVLIDKFSDDIQALLRIQWNMEAMKDEDKSTT